MDEKQTKKQEITNKLCDRLERVLCRMPNIHELANAASDPGLLVQLLLDEIVDIKLRLDKGKL